MREGIRRLFLPDHVNRQSDQQHNAKFQADHNVLRHDSYPKSDAIYKENATTCQTFGLMPGHFVDCMIEMGQDLRRRNIIMHDSSGRNNTSKR
ncbi:MAG: hypothetical protein ABI171_21760 [Collimonas sp.]|uniref:hypothetical protein n=1 Tax=Collimonas sp. TaxID=1963772 RepID=UPI003266D52B